MEQESAEAAARAVLALWLSGGAVVVALAAAGFTFWQAFIQHRAWSQSQSAEWVFSANRPHSGPHPGWFLSNIGGGAATDVRLTVKTVFPTKPVMVFEAVDQIPPGETVLLGETRSRRPPRDWSLRDDEKGTYRAVKQDDDRSQAMRLYGQWADVSWTDARGKTRTSRVSLY